MLRTCIILLYLIPTACCTTSYIPLSDSNIIYGYLVRYSNSDIFESVFQEATGIDMNPPGMHSWTRGVAYARDVTGSRLFIVGYELRNNLYNILATVTINNGELDAINYCSKYKHNTICVAHVNDAYDIKNIMDLTNEGDKISSTIVCHKFPPGHSNTIGQYYSHKDNDTLCIYEYSTGNRVLSVPMYNVMNTDIIDKHVYANKIIESNNYLYIILYYDVKAKYLNYMDIYRTPKCNLTTPTLWLRLPPPKIIMGVGRLIIEDIDEKDRYITVYYSRDLPLCSYDYLYDVYINKYIYAGLSGGIMYLRFHLPALEQIRREAKMLKVVGEKNGIVYYRRN